MIEPSEAWLNEIDHEEGLQQRGKQVANRLIQIKEQKEELSEEEENLKIELKEIFNKLELDKITINGYRFNKTVRKVANKSKLTQFLILEDLEPVQKNEIDVKATIAKYQLENYDEIKTVSETMTIAKIKEK